MADFPNFNDLFRVAATEVLVRNARLSRDAVERDGSDVNVLVAAACAAADECVGQLQRASAALFLDTATGRDLDVLVFDRYGMLRKPAAPALGQVSFTTTSATALAFLIPQGTVLQTAAGVQFQTTADVQFPVASTGPVVATVRSVLAGSTQQAKAGSITTIASSITNAPADLAVANAAATAGADDAEGDDSLRDRARRFFTAARAGTLRALEAAALGVPGVRTATAFEAMDAVGRPARLVGLVVSDAYTESLATLATVPATYQAQSQALAQTVFSALADVRAAGVYVQVIVAQVLLQTVQLALSFQAGADVDLSATQARAAILDYVNNLRPGATFDRVAAVGKLRTITGLIVTGNEIVTPAANVVVSPLQVLRSSLSLIQVVSATFNTALQAPAGGFNLIQAVVI